MHTHIPENYMNTGYPLGMVLYSKFWITFLSLNNCQLIKKFHNTVKKILLEAHRHQWALNRNTCSDGKLRTYVKFKTVYGRENYLSLMFWRNLTKFRIPSHHLHIESGRYIRVHLRSQGYVSSAAQVKLRTKYFVGPRWKVLKTIALYTKKTSDSGIKTMPLSS